MESSHVVDIPPPIRAVDDSIVEVVPSIRFPHRPPVRPSLDLIIQGVVDLLLCKSYMRPGGRQARVYINPLSTLLMPDA
jgi:hypothetical protein